MFTAPPSVFSIHSYFVPCTENQLGNVLQRPWRWNCVLGLINITGGSVHQQKTHSSSFHSTQSSVGTERKHFVWEVVMIFFLSCFLSSFFYLFRLHRSSNTVSLSCRNGTVSPTEQCEDVTGINMVSDALKN